MNEVSKRTRSDEDPTQSGARSSLLVAGVLVGAVVIAVVAVLMTGPASEPVDQGVVKEPPPLALPSSTPTDGALAKAAAQLAAGDLDDARAGFTNVVARDHDNVVAQVGLILSRWRTTGAKSVERDLQQLAKENPESAYVTLHLGLVQTLRKEPRAARGSFQDAVTLGRSAGDETSLRMARVADDLLHPDAFRGDLPLLVAPNEVPAGERAALSSLIRAVSVGDRAAIARTARGVDARSSAMLRIAALAAVFDKGAPDATIDRLHAIARDPATPRVARDRARMLAALALAWSGGSRASACEGLQAAALPQVDSATRRLAGPIAKEICGSSPSM